jgi:hypothetical protein
MSPKMRPFQVRVLCLLVAVASIAFTGCDDDEPRTLSLPTGQISEEQYIAYVKSVIRERLDIAQGFCAFLDTLDDRRAVDSVGLPNAVTPAAPTPSEEDIARASEVVRSECSRVPR